MTSTKANKWRVGPAPQHRPVQAPKHGCGELGRERGVLGAGAGLADLVQGAAAQTTGGQVCVEIRDVEWQARPFSLMTSVQHIDLLTQAGEPVVAQGRGIRHDSPAPCRVKANSASVDEPG